MPAASIATLFIRKPRQWGLRGDPFLWAELAAGFRDTPLPARESELLAALESAFERTIGVSVSSTRECVYVERFAQGGMSSGQVSLEFWREKAFPLILQRYRAALRKQADRSQ